MRKLGYQDDAAVHAALLRLQKFSEAYEWAIGIDFNVGEEAIWAARHGAYVVDGYLVMTEVITPWYSTQKVLQEWLVLKLYEDGDINSVPAALQELAHLLDCRVVITADSSPVSIVAAAYEKAGYSSLTHSFYKKV